MDPLDLTELASSIGAGRLAELLGDTRARPVAIAALAYADDAEVAYAKMASEALAHPGADAAALLDSFSRSLDRPTKRGEILDSEGTHRAIGDLMTIARDASRAEAERAKAASILHRLAARGFVDDATVP
jgi:hypothetical protein